MTWTSHLAHFFREHLTNYNFLTTVVADRRLEDEGTGEEAAGPTGKARRSSRQSPPRISEESAESRSCPVGVHEPDRRRLSSSRATFEPKLK